MITVILQEFTDAVSELKVVSEMDISIQSDTSTKDANGDPMVTIIDKC